MHRAGNNVDWLSHWIPFKIDPFKMGDLQERDTRGRVNEVAVVDNWLITYWSDHAAREIRIVNLELVED